MHLDQLRVQDFQAYQKATVALPDRGLVFVAGANNSGKSSFLSALRVAAGQGMTPEMRHAGGGAPVVWARYCLSSSDQMEIIETSRNQLGGSIFEGVKWLEVKFETTLDGGTNATKITASRRDGEPFPLAEITFDPWDRMWILKTIAAPSDLPKEGSSALTLVERMKLGGPPSLFSADQLPQLSKFSSAIADWRVNFFHFPAHRPGGLRSQNMNSSPRLDPSGGNLASVLMYTYTNFPELWEKLQHYIAQIIPAIGELRIPTNGNEMRVTFVDPYRPGFHHNLKDLGTGVEQLLLTLVLGLTHPAPAVVAIEEPETALHPAAQRALLGLLSSWAKERLYVITTHSPVLLDTQSESVHVLSVRRNEGRSTIEPMSSAIVEVFKDLGVRPSDALSADRLLLVEGPSDKEILGVWFPQILSNPRVVIIEGQGGDNARHAHVLQSWIKSADKLGERRVLYLRDRDELSDRLIANLQRTGSVFILPVRELENYLLLPEVVASVLTNELTRFISPEEISSAVEEAAISLRNVVILKRVCWELPPLRLIDNSLRSSLAGAHATVEDLVSAVTQRIPMREDFERKVRDLWAKEASLIDREWDDHRLELVPGADVLNLVWKNIIGRSYRKSEDGKKLAAQAVNPPAGLAEVIENFLGSD
ncbi:AAA family ATPase [Streptosporangium subroseum]|uniref:AAA family ATPase n=1 Tax=Streptosporangium subroseum TaxID=106412 RepID=UPI0030904BB8|nr:AAA family ATPase [Streptosporangium subroseum]